MIDEDILKLIKPVIDCFADLNISYHIGGSIASSAYGFPRTTADVDLGTEITLDHVRPLVKRLEKNYFIQESAIRDAITERRSFNIIHLETMFKIDVFVSKGRPFDRQANLRKRKEALDERREFSFYLSSPEDTILYKLEWYKTGGGVSERQWNDLVGVIKVQKHNLDKKYLLKWANELEVTNLLKRALIESGFEEDT